MDEIRKAAGARNIEYAIHFTRRANITRILEEGLIPRAELETEDQPPNFNDAHRFDLQKDATCCSVGFPNYRMFFPLRQQTAEDWVVCLLKPEILWEKECAFCIENAASNRVTCIDLDQRKGIGAFNAMFEEIEGKPERSVLGIPDDCPTNPQAEILVFGRIEPTYIYGAGCSTRKAADELAEQYEGLIFDHFPSLFSARKDYANWQ